MEICNARKRPTPSLRFASNKKVCCSSLLPSNRNSDDVSRLQLRLCRRQRRGRRRTHSTTSPSPPSLSTTLFLRSPLLSNPLRRLVPFPSRNRKPIRSPLDLLSDPRRPTSSIRTPPPLDPLLPTAAHRPTMLTRLSTLAPLPLSKSSLPSLPRLLLPLRPSSAISTLSSCPSRMATTT